MWALVVYHPEEDRTLVLLTYIPITYPAEAQLVYDQWRHHTPLSISITSSRKEAGLDVEDIRVQSLEVIRRLFVLVLLMVFF
jgi:hypothetical protein